MVSVSKRLRRAPTDAILLWSLLLGAAGVVASYVIVAHISLDTLAVWQYNAAAAKSIGLLLAICLCIFVPFVAPGVVVATLFGRRPEGIGGLYFADLLGAGLACAIVIYLAGSIGPPATIMLGALALLVGALHIAGRRRSRTLPLVVLMAAGATVLVVAPGLLPAQRLDTTKASLFVGNTIYSAWSPIFRVDVVQATPDVRLLYHDGLIGSAIYRWNGKVASLAHYDFANDPRSIPFAVTGSPPRREAIIGAAGGHEVLASLYFGAGHVDAVELNPVTYSLVKTTYADFDGHLAQDPAVNYVNGDGRSYLARSHTKYNLIWYPAPDSYAATNAATASAFVLSESYLYTTNAVEDALQHLSGDGIFVAQFGEVDYQDAPVPDGAFRGHRPPGPGRHGRARPRRPHPRGQLARPLPGQLHPLHHHRQGGAVHDRRGRPLRRRLEARAGDEPAVRAGPCREAEPGRHHRDEHGAAAQLLLLLVPLRRRAHHGQRPLLLARGPLRHRAVGLLPPHHVRRS